MNVVSSFHPDLIEEDIIKYLTDQKITPKVDEKKYKIKFDFESQMDHLKNANYKISVCIRILKVDEEKVVVEFTKLSGPLDKYTEIVEDLKKSKFLANIFAWNYNLRCNVYFRKDLNKHSYNTNLNYY